MVRGDLKKRLDLKRIGEIKRAAGSLLTLHGGSGTEDHDLQDAIAAGINIVHINTELRVSWRRGMEDAFAQKPREVVPYRLLPIAKESVKQVVVARLRLSTNRKCNQWRGKRLSIPRTIVIHADLCPLIQTPGSTTSRSLTASQSHTKEKFHEPLSFPVRYPCDVYS
jgi:Fructose-bisphosphate aldolase class-II